MVVLADPDPSPELSSILVLSKLATTDCAMRLASSCIARRSLRQASVLSNEV
jgi:hypothetical protein